MTLKQILQLKYTTKPITDTILGDWFYSPYDSNLVLNDLEFDKLDHTELPQIEVRSYDGAQNIGENTFLTLYSIYYLDNPVVLVYKVGDGEDYWIEERFIFNKNDFRALVQAIHNKIPQPDIYEDSVDFEIEDLSLVN